MTSNLDHPCSYRAYILIIQNIEAVLNIIIISLTRILLIGRMSTEEVNMKTHEVNGDGVVVPQERVKRPTRPDDVAQKAIIDELQASSMCISGCMGCLLT